VPDPTLETDVAIVGAGPVGLSVALGLARQGVRSVLLEREESTSDRSKAPGIHIRTREAFRRWGVEEAFRRAGTLLRELRVVDVTRRRALWHADLGVLDDEADRPGLLILEQGVTEDLLLAAVVGSGRCDVRFRTEAVGVQQGPEGVVVTGRRADAEVRVRARFAVGCDGASSFVRDALGWELRGHTYRLRPMLADVRVDDRRDALDWPRVCNDAEGMTVALRLRPGRWRIIDLSGGEGPDEVDEQELRRAVRRVLGPGPFAVEWSNRFRMHRRAVERFREGRVILAGDAAHLHSPVGGQGMNGGIQDAENLAWKLSGALRGGDVDRLLDSYDEERRGVVVQDVSRVTDLLTRAFVQAPAAVRSLAFAATRASLRIPAARRLGLRRLSMLALRTPPSPLLDAEERAAGQRLPNPLLDRRDGPPVRLHDLLPAGFTLLALGDVPAAVDPVAVDAVVPVAAGADRRGLLRHLLGAPAGWILVRPDGVVAFARHAPEGLAAAARRASGAGRREDASMPTRGGGGGAGR
jgi:2-polyprenyl-6-methoxyphenol hydroxylase-like FAD-dependent oxidoreductase